METKAIHGIVTRGNKSTTGYLGRGRALDVQQNELIDLSNRILGALIDPSTWLDGAYR